MSVTYDFSGRNAVVTGGANGIGRAIAEELRDAGAAVHVWDLTAPGFSGVEHSAVDVTDGDTIEAAIEALDGKIDLLVNNAGFAGPTIRVEDYEPEQWRHIVEVNLFGVYEVSRLVVPVMRRAGWGRIVNMASLAGKEGTPNASAYSAAKAGVIAFTKSLAKELAATEVRVNCVAPAAIETSLLEQVTPEFLRIMIDKSPMQRLGTVEEVAAIVMWLCSEDCSFNTGAVFDLSGGRATY